MTAPKNDKPTPLDDSPQARAARLAMTFVGFLDMITALASPRIMATIAALPPEEQPKFLTSVDAFLVMVPDFQHEKTRAAEAPIHELRALLATWTPGSVVPIEIQSKARIVLTAFRVPEPPEGWDRFEGAPDAPPAERPAPRVLRSEPMTIEEWVTWQGPGEVVDGILVEERASRPSPNGKIVNWLVDRLRDWALPRGGVVHGPGHKLVTSPKTGRKPDICVYMPSSTIPLLVVEVPSPDLVDQYRARVSMMTEHAALGVPWYWILSPSERLFESFSRDAKGRYMLFLCAEDGAEDGDAAEAGIEGLRVDLDALWAESERP